MFKNTKFRQWFLALTGGVIGAWFFSLPKSILNTWSIPSIVILLGVWIMVIILHLILAEVSLSVPWHKTFVWLAKTLFPHWLAKATTAITIINFFIGILAYSILWWSFMQTLLDDIGIHIHHVRTVCIYTIIISYFTRQWLEKSHKRDAKLVIIGIICIGLIVLAWVNIWTDISSLESNWMSGLSLYGIALFAMSSIGIIPLLYEITWKSAITMRSVIISSGAFVTICCICFGLAVISISGDHTTSDSVRWLYFMGWKMIWFIGSILWCCAIISCHIPMATHLKEIFSRDQKIPVLLSRRTITVLPLLLYLYFDPNIIKTLSIAWWLLWGTLTILVALMNIRLHSTAQKVKIIPMIAYDQLRSRVLIIVCGVGVLYNIFALY